MKRILQLLLIAALIPALAHAQDNNGGWSHEGVFPPDSSHTNSAQGVAVDGEGKVWIQAYYPYQGWETPDGDELARVHVIYVYNPDGSEAFDPIYTFGEDTLLGLTGGTGLSRDNDGNILASYHNNNEGSFILQLDQEDGSLIQYFDIPPDRGDDGFHAPLAPIVTEDNHMIVGYVFSRDQSIQVYDLEDGEMIYELSNDHIGLSRALAANSDGTKIYYVPFADAGDRIMVYEGDYQASFGGDYTVSDSALVSGVTPGAAALQPGTGHLWFAADGGAAPGTPEGSAYSAYTLYGIDVNTKTIIDSVQVETTGTPADDFIIRTMAFSEDGTELYVGNFNQGPPSIQKFTFSGDLPTSSETEPTIADGYELSQNYPNPFNPTTQISFTLADAGLATLRVYDVLGRQVATLVDENLSAGTHRAQFDAVNLTSGMYIYKLQANGVELTNKMMLVK